MKFITILVAAVASVALAMPADNAGQALGARDVLDQLTQKRQDCCEDPRKSP